jgi:hypothetical protein
MRTLKTIHWMSGRKLEIHRTSSGEVQNLLKETIEWQQHIQRDRIRQILQEDVGESVGDKRKDHRMSIYEDFTRTCQTNPRFLNCIVIRDESWVFQEDLATTHQFMKRRSPASSRPKRWACNGKDQNAVDRFLLWTGCVPQKKHRGGGAWRKTADCKFHVPVLRSLLKRRTQI